MSFLSYAYMLEKYGLRLTIEQLSAALSMPTSSIHNAISKGTFGIPTYLDGKRRYADYRDVLEHLDKCRERAKIPD
jgi:2-hydroxychromene-2-carboxylate isomerase